MSHDETVTAWIAGLKAGNDGAVQRIWERYFTRLVGLARKMLQATPRSAADEEDVALSAFKSFYFRAVEGKFPRLENRDDLWKLLMTITVRKAVRVSRTEFRQPFADDVDFLSEQLVDTGPTPDFVVIVKDELDRLLGMLSDDQLQQIAVMKLEGHTNLEVAERIARSASSVERKLRLIRRIWSQEPMP